MTIITLVSWQVLGVLLGAAIAAVWKIRGLTVAWGIASGGVGGVVGGMLCRIVLPHGPLFDGLTIAGAIIERSRAVGLGDGDPDLALERAVGDAEPPVQVSERRGCDAASSGVIRPESTSDCSSANRAPVVWESSLSWNVTSA